MLVGSPPLNRVLSVVLKVGEDIEWVWMSLPGGGSYVSGYRIVKLIQMNALRDLPLEVAP